MNLSDALDPANSDELRAVATAIAGMERDLHTAVQDHYEALGAEPPADRNPPEERVEQLCSLVEHLLSDDLWGYFLLEQAPDGLTNADAARRYAGTDDFEATIQRLADERRAATETNPDVADRDDRDLAAAAIRDRFGVSLSTFETAVVGWSPERTLQVALRGRVDSDTEHIAAATRAIESGTDD
ncbi:MAG: hypothetical protein PPP58_05075 [Natronomonas sp.]